MKEILGEIVEDWKDVEREKNKVTNLAIESPAYIYREDNSLQVLYLHLNSINHPHSSALLQNLVLETSCGHNLKCLLGEKALVVGQAAQGQNRRLRGAILLHDASHRAPGRHDVGVMHYGHAVDRVAAAGQGDPELLPDGDLVGVGDVFGGGGVLIRDEPREDVAGRGVQRVPGADAIGGPLEGDPGAAGVEAGEILSISIGVTSEADCPLPSS